MGVGPNYVLDKGHVATGSTQYSLGEVVIAQGDGTKVARATTASATVPARGICYETVDAAKVLTGKAVIDIRMLGIARVLAGAAVTLDARLTYDTTARAVAITRATAGAQPASSFGIALTAATAAGQYIDVLLTPGASY